MDETTTKDRPTVRVTLGDLLKRVRLDMGLDQQQFGALIGASRSAVGAYERDRNQPTFGVIRRIVEVSGATWLYDEPFRDNEGAVMRCYQNSPDHGLITAAA